MCPGVAVCSVSCPHPLRVPQMCSEVNRGSSLNLDAGYMWPGKGNPIRRSHWPPALGNPARAFPSGCAKTPEDAWCSGNIGTFPGISRTRTSHSEAEAPCKLSGHLHTFTGVTFCRLPSASRSWQSVAVISSVKW